MPTHIPLALPDGPLLQERIREALPFPIRGNSIMLPYDELPMAAKAVGYIYPSLITAAREYERRANQRFTFAGKLIERQLGEFELRPYQIQAAAFLVSSGSGLLSLEMGLGKTAVTVAAIRALPNIKRTIVIAPAAVKRQWCRELLRMGIEGAILQDGSKDFYSLKKIQRDGEVEIETKFVRMKDAELGETHEWFLGKKPYEAAYPKDYSWLVTNYELLDRLAEAKKTAKGVGVSWHLEKPDCVVLDESHFIKESQARRSKVASYYLTGVPHKFLLTGTPIINRPLELFSQLRLLNPHRFSSEAAFEKRYCGRKTKKVGEITYRLMREERLEELQLRLRTILFRRTKEQVAHDLPPKRRAFLEVHLPIRYRIEYDKAEDDLVNWLRMHGAMERASAAVKGQTFAKLGYLRQIVSAGKMSATLDLLRRALTNGVEKIVTFSAFLQVVRTIQKRFGEQCVSYSGDQTPPQRQKAVDAFWKNEGVNVFAATTEAGGTGLNLQVSRLVIFNDLPWSPAAATQAESRLHRLGVSNTVISYILYAGDTIDEHIIGLLREKAEVVKQILGATPMEFEGAGVRWLLQGLMRRRGIRV